LFKAGAGPLAGALLGAAVGFILGLKLLEGAGHGVAHSGAAAGVVLGFWALGILAGAALGLGLFLALATVVRGVLFACGRRPWPWRGSVQLGALSAGLGIFFGLDRLGRHPLGPDHEGAATVLQLAADTLGLLLAFPAVIAGGLLGAWAHRRLVVRR